jgi:sugar/nucleoside kinase (ribokinase family)
MKEREIYHYDVVVIGDVFYDIATMPVRSYPERDKQIGCEFMLSIGGQAGNCAAACASLGLKTALICKTGNDVLSKWITSELQKLGVGCFASNSEKGELQHPGITVSISFEDGSRSMLSKTTPYSGREVRATNALRNSFPASTAVLSSSTSFRKRAR